MSLLADRLEDFGGVAHKHSQARGSTASPTQAFRTSDVTKNGAKFVGDLRELLIDTSRSPPAYRQAYRRKRWSCAICRYEVNRRSYSPVFSGDHCSYSCLGMVLFHSQMKLNVPMRTADRPVRSGSLLCRNRRLAVLGGAHGCVRSRDRPPPWVQSEFDPQMARGRSAALHCAGLCRAGLRIAAVA
jgi:hypothetical protein